MSTFFGNDEQLIDALFDAAKQGGPFGDIAEAAAERLQYFHRDDDVSAIAAAAPKPSMNGDDMIALGTEDLREPITEDWLKSVGFKWHQGERQPYKHWLLWCGASARSRRMLASIEDIGIELAPAWWQNRNGEDLGEIGAWHVWFRSDVAGRYGRFLHVRHMECQDEIIKLVEAVTGQDWNPDNHLYGSVQAPEYAARIRRAEERLDHRIRRDDPWRESEKDETRSRPLPEDIDALDKARQQGNGNG